MLGPQAEEIMLSRDPANAGTALDGFLARYDQEHWINQQNPRRVVLRVGPDYRPLPIPLVKTDWSGWYFDTTTVVAQLQQRRLARNDTQPGSAPGSDGR